MARTRILLAIILNGYEEGSFERTQQDRPRRLEPSGWTEEGVTKIRSGGSRCRSCAPKFLLGGDLFRSEPLTLNLVRANDGFAESFNLF
jgi:hypothetical protein